MQPSLIQLTDFYSMASDRLTIIRIKGFDYILRQLVFNKRLVLWFDGISLVQHCPFICAWNFRHKYSQWNKHHKKIRERNADFPATLLDRMHKFGCAWTNNVCMSLQNTSIFSPEKNTTEWVNWLGAVWKRVHAATAEPSQVCKRNKQTKSAKMRMVLSECNRA